MFLGFNDVAFLASVSAPDVVLDPDAAAYIAAVEAADTQALEPAVRAAINDFVAGCKADGIWDAIKASCILAGARTLNGALVPLVGAAPTNTGPFVSGDYDRKTWLKSDGSTKYLVSNRTNTDDPQNSRHLSVWVSEINVSQRAYIGDSLATGGTRLRLQTDFTTRAYAAAGTQVTVGSSNNPGLIGVNRANSSQITYINTGSATTVSNSSAIPTATENYLVFGVSGYATKSNARLAFYSIGESLDLALLDARVTDLINAFDAAI